MSYHIVRKPRPPPPLMASVDMTCKEAYRVTVVTDPVSGLIVSADLFKIKTWLGITRLQTMGKVADLALGVKHMRNLLEDLECQVKACKKRLELEQAELVTVCKQLPAFDGRPMHERVLTPAIAQATVKVNIDMKQAPKSQGNNSGDGGQTAKQKKAKAYKKRQADEAAAHKLNNTS